MSLINHLLIYVASFGACNCRLFGVVEEEICGVYMQGGTKLKGILQCVQKPF